MSFWSRAVRNAAKIIPHVASIASGKGQSSVDLKRVQVTNPLDTPSFPFTPPSGNRLLPTTSVLDSSSCYLNLAGQSLEPAGRHQTQLETPESENDMAGSSRADATQAKPAQDATLHDRLGCVLEYAKRAGFDSFDDLASRYYTADFEDSSGLSNEQRLSRMRRLPAFLVAIHDSSSNWAKFERQAYQDEILKSAESILSAECSMFSHSRALKDELIRLGRSVQEPSSSTTVNNHNEGLLPGLNTTIKNVLQDKVKLLFLLHVVPSLAQSSFVDVY